MTERRGSWDLGEFYRLTEEQQAFWYGREVAIIEGRDGPARERKGGLTGPEEAEYLRRVNARRGTAQGAA